MNISDLIPGATYAIDYDGSLGHEPWKGLAIYQGVDVFAGYVPNSLCFSCLDDNGKLDGCEGVFNLEHVSTLSQRQGSTHDQLAELYRIAIKLKMYDAAQWLETHRAEKPSR